MDEFNYRKNPPSDEEFLKMLLELFGGNKTVVRDYIVDLNDLTSQIRLLLQDEFNCDARIEKSDIISLRFTNGERFNIKIEKCGLAF